MTRCAPASSCWPPARGRPSPTSPAWPRSPYLTSDNVMRLDALPKSMVVLGGGYIAAEMSHIFGSLGTKITIVTRGQQLLSRHDVDIRPGSPSFTGQQFDVRLGATVKRVVGDPARGPARPGHRRRVPQVADGEVLLVATGRVPNSDRLNVAAAGIEVDEHGHVRTDDTYATNVPGIWAFGDLANHFQLKHMANAEARLVRHNLLHPDQPRGPASRWCRRRSSPTRRSPRSARPSRNCRPSGRPYVRATRLYRDTAYGWALEDTTSFVKVLADPATRLLLGAHIIGPQASTLIQPLIQAMCLGNTVDQVASGVLYIHPALTEVVEQALLGLGVEDDTAMPVHIKAAED